MFAGFASLTQFASLTKLTGFVSLNAYASFAKFAGFLTLYTGLYAFAQRQVYRASSFLGLEAAVPPVKRGALKELALTTVIDSGIILHTFAAIRFGNAFQPTNLWIESQYALEIAVKLAESVKGLWNPSVRAPTELLSHHALSLLLLTVSYASNHTTLGFAILSATNLSNLFFDYFKYGLLTGDPVLRWMSSVIFTGMFFMSRVYILGHDILLPLFARSNLLVSIPVPLACFYTVSLWGLYVLQLDWFYRLVRHTWRNTQRLFHRPNMEDQMKTDFMQLIQHLTEAEATIQRHLRSHAFAESQDEAESQAEAFYEHQAEGEAFCEHQAEGEPPANNDGTSSTSGLDSTDSTSKTSSTIPTEIEPFDIQSLLKNTKCTDEDAIIDEALSQWRSCLFKALNEDMDKNDKKDN